MTTTVKIIGDMYTLCYHPLDYCKECDERRVPIGDITVRKIYPASSPTKRFTRCLANGVLIKELEQLVVR